MRYITNGGQWLRSGQYSTMATSVSQTWLTVWSMNSMEALLNEESSCDTGLIPRLMIRNGGEITFGELHFFLNHPVYIFWQMLINCQYWLGHEKTAFQWPNFELILRSCSVPRGANLKHANSHKAWGILL